MAATYDIYAPTSDGWSAARRILPEVFGRAYAMPIGNCGMIVAEAQGLAPEVLEQLRALKQLQVNVLERN